MPRVVLDTKVLIETMGTSQDAAGQPITGWTTVCNPWANIKTLSGIGTLRASADVSIEKVSIRIRYRADVKAGMRVTARGRQYQIKAEPIMIDRKAYLDLVCEGVR